LEEILTDILQYF